MTKQIAFLGLGLMGGAMAANLARKGYEVKAWNRTKERPGIKVAADGGAKIVASIQDAVANAEIIFTCVGDVPDVEEVLLGDTGVVEYAKAGSLIVDMSTIGSDAAKKIHDRLQQHQLRFMDAPVSGGDIGAKNGTLTIMVGGSEADFQKCLPYLKAMGRNITLCGAVGSGQGVKMCNQVLCALYMVGICEAIEMAKQQNIDPNLIVQVCGTGAAGSWALSNLAEKIIDGDYQPGFAIEHILKDLRLVKEIDRTNLPGVELANRLFELVRDLDNGAKQGTQAMYRAYGESNKKNEK
jgi:3-hydroxyisobutyrate dehydrogenase